MIRINDSYNEGGVSLKINGKEESILILKKFYCNLNKVEINLHFFTA
jgi:hypothetical protein